ncbi:MAG: hypothetical protein DRN06_06425, partial [Thermoprotei archaeon]
PEGRFCWGRAFLNWRGKVTLDGEVIEVNAKGVCEMTRFVPGKTGGIVRSRGVVKHIPLEGGFYGIVAEGGRRYLPLNLPQEFKRDGLKVRFEGRVKREVGTIYMWGTPLEIVRISPIGE